METTQSCAEAIFAVGWARMAQKPVVSASVSKLLPTTRFTMVRLLVVPVVEVRRLRMGHLEHGFWRDPQFRADRLDRLPLDKMGRTGPRHRFINKHLNLALVRHESACEPQCQRGPGWASITPIAGHFFACRVVCRSLAW